MKLISFGDYLFQLLIQDFVQRSDALDRVSHVIPTVAPAAATRKDFVAVVLVGFNSGCRLKR